MARARSPKTLRPDQMAAAEPSIHASLSASAGTGKTQVLTARVLRLLLEGAPPESILCLTFTKAAAAEMAERIGHQLATWVRLSDRDLSAEPAASGAGGDARAPRRAGAGAPAARCRRSLPRSALGRTSPRLALPEPSSPASWIVPVASRSRPSTASARHCSPPSPLDP